MVSMCLSHFVWQIIATLLPSILLVATVTPYPSAQDCQNFPLTAKTRFKAEYNGLQSTQSKRVLLECNNRTMTATTYTHLS